MKGIILSLFIVFSAGIRGQGVSDALAERIYLQTDKQLYLAGELVYIKVFTVTIERKPLSFSKIVYVELLNETTPLAQVKIELTNGVGESWMELPLNLSTGHYRLVAYTRFMRNESESVFFEKNIGVVNTFRPNQIRKEQTDVLPQIPEISDSQTCLLHPDKQVYTNREKGILKLDGLPEDIHTLSVSIAGKSPISIDGANSICQWEKQALAISSEPLEKYLPEYEGHIITGKIVPLQARVNTGSEIIVPILSFPGEKLYLFEGMRDIQNNVSFHTANTAGVNEVFTTVYTTTGDIYRIDLQSPFVEQHLKKQLPALRIDSSHFENLLDRTVALQALYSYTKPLLVEDRSDDFRFTMEPDQTYILDEWTRFTVMHELIIECIRELRFRRNDQQKMELLKMKILPGDPGFLVRPLVVLDGIPIFDHEMIYHYNPLLVERINIYSGEYIYGGGGLLFEGIVEFLTYGRNFPSLPTDPSTEIVSYAGTQASHRFYMPDYSSEENRQSPLPDYRHTLLWVPMLQTKGKSTMEIPFYTSDFVGEFQVTVEGLTREGKIIYSTTSFEVR